MDAIKLPDALIPPVPAGAKPFTEYDLKRRRIRVEHVISYSFWELGENLTDLEKIIKQVKKEAAKKLKVAQKDLPEITMSFEGEPYEGYDRIEFEVWRYETDEEVLKRLNVQIARKQRYIDKKNSVLPD